MMNAITPPILSAAELAQAALPRRPAILAPILPRAGQGLIYGPAGVGKSFMALGMAYAAATGTRFLRWRATRPHQVVYVDGELGPAELQRRLALFGPPPLTLKFSLAALNPGPLLDLADSDGQQRLMESWGDPELVVIDDTSSLSNLFSAADRWHDLQRFLMLQRQWERAVLLVHHANREGRPRGLSRREDSLDFILGLRRPQRWLTGDGACFEIHMEKARSVHGTDREPIVACLQDRDWHWTAAHHAPFERGVELLNNGMRVEAMGRALGISRASAFRLRRRARELGQLT
jgi:putative DNA primase/helicase